jgi:hypothetical protein
MISKRKNISVVYLDVAGDPGQKLSGLIKTQGQWSALKIVESKWKYALCAWYLSSYCDRQADVGCCVLFHALHKSDHKIESDPYHDAQILLQQFFHK